MESRCGGAWRARVAGPPGRERRLGLAVGVVACVLALVAPVPAGATFTREFLREISAAGSAPLVPGGVAVDGKDDLWVESARESLAEFSPAYEAKPNEFLEPLVKLEGPDRLEALAVENASEDFYVTGDTHSDSAGGVVVYDSAEWAILQEWGTFQAGTIAVDNSPMGSLEDPSACGPVLSTGCFVYVTETGENGGIKKLDREGHEQAFTFDEACEKAKCGYVHANEITGIPSQPKGVFAQGGLNGVAVDSKGDIYANNAARNAVYEYAASGEFIQEFNLESLEVPRIAGRVGRLKGVAVDPLSKHVLVSLDAVNGGTSIGAVDEFDPATGKFVAEIAEAAPGTQLNEPIGVAVDSLGDVYVVDQRPGTSGVVDVYGPGAFLPTLVLGAGGQRRPESAVLSGSVNPEGFQLTECKFQYVSEETFSKEGFANPGKAECEPAASKTPPDKEPHLVKAGIVGLMAGVTYRYRLLAHSEGELGGTAVSPPLAFTTPAPPKITPAAAANVSSTFAELDAQINPRGAATSYYFEYGPTTGYGHDAPAQSEAAPDGIAIGSGGPTGGASESVAQQISGLTPGTEYHFRVVAENELTENGKTVYGPETSYGPDETFTTLPEVAPGLPDGRAYELVTPADKEGGSDMFAEKENNGEYFNRVSVGTPSRSGDGFLLQTKSAFGAFPSAFFSEYVFQRDAARGEWTYTPLASPSLGVQSILLEEGTVFDPADLSRVGFTDAVGAQQSAEGERPTDLVGVPGGPYTTLHTDPGFHESELVGHIETRLVGASRDLHKIVLESNSNSVCPNPGKVGEKVEEGTVLCEWDSGFETLEDGEVIPELRLVNLAPGSEPKPASTCGALLGSGEKAGGAHNAVSSDGSRVFFTAPQRFTRVEGGPLSGPGCWNQEQEEKTGKPVNPPQLYARIEQTEPLGEAVHATLKVSAPAAGVLEEVAGKLVVPREYPAGYVGASEDGSKVFFVSEAWLTADHPETHDLELYECEIILEGETPACKLTRISIPLDEKGEPDPKAVAVVDWVPAVSADGSTVYFTAFNVLAENGTHDTPAGNGEDGEVNVYRYDTDTATTSYVATVNTEDYTNQPRCIGILGAIGPCSVVDWYTTADGRYLLFGASLAIAGYNTAVAGCHGEVLFEQNGVDGRCSELYRYDAGAAHGEQPLVCVSCGPGGADSEGNAEFARSATEAPAAGPPAGISENGAYVFFDSSAKLVAQADNATLDVYEWEAQGTGGCGLAQGCVHLLSSPNDPFPSYFLGYTPYEYETATHEKKVVEGGDVFFGTHASLVAQDTNSVGNIYDARICQQESPCIKPPPSPPVQCEGNTCQTPPTTAGYSAPASMTFSGPGDQSASSEGKATSKSTLTNAQKLAVALKACHKHKVRGRRVVCERRARKRYGPAKKAKAKKASNDRRSK